MPDIPIGVHTVRSHGVKIVKVRINDWLIDLLLLVAIEIMLNSIEPFPHFVSEEMMADLKYPFKEDTVPFWAVLCLLFSVLITGVITDAIKDAVGRPRRNFFWRCLPDGIAVFHPVTQDVICSSDEAVIMEGYKSFQEVQIQNRSLQRNTSRTLLIHDGTTVASFCYLQSFPYPNAANGWAPHAYFQMLAESNGVQSSMTRLSSLQMKQQETATAFYESDGVIQGCSSSSSHLVLDALEAGRKY